MTRSAFTALVATIVMTSCSREPPPSTPPGHQARSATLLFMADPHGYLEPHPELFWRPDGTQETTRAGGYARIATIARQVRNETAGRALLIDGGDTFQGSAVASWSQGEAIVGPQRALAVDLGIPGNWEVVYGYPQLKRLATELNYPLLATNVVDAATGQLAFAPTVLRNVDGLRIGFVGFTDPDVPLRQSPSYSKGLRYLGTESLAPYVRSVREQEHADVVVLITHIGLARSVALADQVSGVDIILSGDSHERVYEPIVRNGVVVVEPGAFASTLGRLDITVRPGARPEYRWKLIELREDAVPPDPGVQAEVDRAVAPYRERLEKVLGTIATPVERYGVVQNTADALLTDAIRAVAHTDIALSNGFRFGHPMIAGPVTEADLWMLYPVDSQLKRGIVTGRQLRDFWESEIDHVFATDAKHLFGGWLPRVSGMTVRFRAQEQKGRRVVDLRVNGQPVEDSRKYSIAACEREGDAADALCRIHNVSDIQPLGMTVHQAVARYLLEHKQVTPPLDSRVTAEDLPSHVYSQYYRK